MAIIDAGAGMQMPSQPTGTAARRHRNSRTGRPPNINENSLMRRLECVMAVESGRMSMLTACQQYDISARTFYRWLRNKERLIELTGFTEADFGEAPEGMVQHQDPPYLGPAADVQQQGPDPASAVTDQPDSNLPMLQPAAVSVSPMGAKRRFPKQTGDRTASPSAVTSGSILHGAIRKPSSAHAKHALSTRIPSVSSSGAAAATHSDAAAAAGSAGPAAAADDDGAEKAQGAPTAAAAAAAGERPEGDGDDPPKVDADGDAMLAAAAGAVAAGSAEGADGAEKQPGGAAGAQGQGQAAAGHATAMGVTQSESQSHALSRARAQAFSRGPGENEDNDVQMYPSRRRASGSGGSTMYANATRLPPENRNRGTDNQQGSDNNMDAAGVPAIAGKHRIEVMMGRRKVIIAWYAGALAEDIKTSISRRFALLPGTYWALIDQEYDEIVVSAGMPSGRYTLTL